MGPNDSIECKMKFDIPDGYFDALADNVMQSIDFDEKRRKRRRANVLRTFGAILVVAFVAGIAVFEQKNSQTNFPVSEEQQFAAYYITNLSQQYSDINVIEYIDQANEQDYDIEDYDADLLAMYASPVNFMY
ncbi:MAG: hypothetical protein J5595_09210 [Bacteroidales bacterium]|nr:hypothetical protein [Bacteroidales bacterium]